MINGNNMSAPARNRCARWRHGLTATQTASRHVRGGGAGDIDSHRTAATALRTAADEVNRLRERLADENMARPDGEQCVFIDVNELQRQAELDKIGTGENDHGMAAALHATALNVLAAMTPEQRALQAKRAEERRIRNQRIRGGGCTCWKADAL